MAAARVKPPVIRPAVLADAPALLAIYRPYVKGTVVSFETQAPTTDELTARLGRLLYQALLEELAAKGFCNALAGIALPNEASMAFHRSLGFEPIGVFKAVGRKFDAWHAVAWLQRRLRDAPP